MPAVRIETTVIRNANNITVPTYVTIPLEGKHLLNVFKRGEFICGRFTIHSSQFQPIKKATLAFFPRNKNWNLPDGVNIIHYIGLVRGCGLDCFIVEDTRCEF